MTVITNLQITLQSRVSERAKRDIVRRDSPDGPYRNRKIYIPVNLPTGPDSGANLAVRRIVVDTLRRRTGKGEFLFYVIAEFKNSTGKGIPAERYTRTIIARSEIPLQLRRV